MAFEKEIKEYEDLRGRYQSLVIDRMDGEEYFKLLLSGKTQKSIKILPEAP